MKTITEQEYYNTPRDYRGVFDSDDIHGTNYNGKRTLLANENGATVLLIEGISFEIVREENQPTNAPKGV